MPRFIRLPAPIALMAFAIGAVVFALGAFLYERMAAPFAHPQTSLQAAASCTVPVGGPVVNEHKQLYISCAGYLD
ncbi:MAG TPA: hypothetical protein VMV50_01620 [Candidatus Paceibacterota bacterium]|nr:hypothetical protein [Candidatus Paceibacterota bacterium]